MEPAPPSSICQVENVRPQQQAVQIGLKKFQTIMISAFLWPDDDRNGSVRVSVADGHPKTAWPTEEKSN
jgi:hypothetical protein